MIYVIIPTYNDNENLVHGLYSLATQHYTEFKVLVVDDCGTESAQPICQSFQDKLQITYLRTAKNGGPGCARQLGLDNIPIEDHDTAYCMFMDSDDALYPNALERLVNAKDISKVDVIYGNIIQETTGEPQVISQIQHWTWLHGKLYRYAFLKENNIHFPKLRTNEDLAFNLIVRNKATICHLDEPVYLWRLNHNSLTHKMSMARLQCQSIDYIDAIYYAFKRVDTLDEFMLNSIIYAYNYYQRAKAYHLTNVRISGMLQTMFNNTKVRHFVINLIKHPTLKFDQYTSYNDKMIFFNETLYQWIAKFFPLEEMQNLLNSEEKHDNNSN